MEMAIYAQNAFNRANAINDVLRTHFSAVYGLVSMDLANAGKEKNTG